jgi:hypothetical protein
VPSIRCEGKAVGHQSAHEFDYEERSRNTESYSDISASLRRALMLMHFNTVQNSNLVIVY